VHTGSLMAFIDQCAGSWALAEEGVVSKITYQPVRIGCESEWCHDGAGTGFVISKGGGTHRFINHPSPSTFLSHNDNMNK
jgi:hypothetical protein